MRNKHVDQLSDAPIENTAVLHDSPDMNAQQGMQEGPEGSEEVNTFEASPSAQRPFGMLVPLPLLVVYSVCALALIIASLVSPVSGGTLLAVSCSAIIVMSMTKRFGSDALVVSLSLLIFWLPFHTTVTRFGISPQETGVYIVWLIGALFSPLGIRRWITEVVRSFSPLMRAVVTLYALACIQALLRAPRTDLVALLYDFRTILIYPLALALLVAYTIRTRNCMRTLLYAFFFGATLFAAYALSLRLLGAPIENGAVAGRLGAEMTFLSEYHPNNLGLYLALALVFAPAFLLKELSAGTIGAYRLIRCAGLSACVLIMVSALWLTYSRGALVAVILGVTLVFFGHAYLGTLRTRLLAIGACGVGVAGVALLIVWKGVGVLGRYAGLTDVSTLSSDPNVQFRASLYARALTVALAHPLDGIGLGAFSQGANVPFSPHNTYLDLWVSTGLFGVIAFVGAIVCGLVVAVRVAAIYRTVQRRRNIANLFALGVAGALLAFMFQAFVETFDQEPRIAPAIWMLIGCSEGIALYLAGQKARQQKRQSAEEGAVSAEVSPSPLSEARDAEAVALMDNPTLLKPSADQPEQPAASTWRQIEPRESTAEQGASPIPSADPFDAEDAKVIPSLDSGWLGYAGPEPLLESPWSSSETTARLQAIRQREAATQPEGQGEQEGRAAVITSQREADHALSATGRRRSQHVAEELLRRAPASYAWNQLYTLWFFVANFVLSIALTHGLSQVQYGLYAVLTTAISTLLFVFAIGLEDAATVFVPRVMARDGSGTAAYLIRRMLLSRLIVMGVVGAAIAYLLPTILAMLGGSANALNDTGGQFLSLRSVLIGLYLLGNSVSTLESAFFGSILKSRTTLIIGGASQALNVAVAAAMLRAGYGLNGVLLALASVALITALAYFVELLPLVRATGGRPMQDMGELRKLMVSAWLTNVTNGALGKQMDIVLMTVFAVSYIEIGYYNLAYQLANIVGVLLISGLGGGVGMAAMSAALSAGGQKQLASIWRASFMAQILFATPLLVLAFVKAGQILTILYGARYIGAAPLLQVFLVFSILGRLIGGGAHQSALYVLGKQRSVLFARWGGLVINVVLDVALIPQFGPIGALMGTGFSQVWVGLIEFLLLRGRCPIRYPLSFAFWVLGASAIPAIILLWWSPVGFVGLAAACVVFLLGFLIVGAVTFRVGEDNDLLMMLTANQKLVNIGNAFRRRTTRSFLLRDS